MSGIRIAWVMALAIGCTGGPRTALAQDIISHPGLSPAALTKTEAVLYFTRRLDAWPDGQSVTVFVLADDDPLHEAFAQQMLGLFPYQLRRTWDRQVFSGTGQAPIRVGSEAEMLRRVATTPGAIGYAKTPSADVRVHRIAGG